MNVLLVRPTYKARQNFNRRIDGHDVNVFECSHRDEARSILETSEVDMALIFLDQIDSELIWICGMVMDYVNIRVVGLMENEEIDIHFNQKLKRLQNKRRKFIYN